MSDSRVRAWFSVFVLVVFCLGLAGGILIGRRMGPPPLAADGRPFGMFGGRGGGPRAAEGLLDRLSTELQLSPDQRTKVKAILDERRTRLLELNRDLIARAETEQKDMQTQIRSVLTPEQQQRFDDYLASARRGRFGRGMRGGPR